MARCKLTRMNLRNIRKTKEYQVLLIDLVTAGVIGQSAAEGILGYTIPAGLLGSTTPADNTDDESDNTVTLLYFNKGSRDQDPAWETVEYDLTDDPTGDGIITFALDAFSDNNVDSWGVVEENAEYVEGTSELSDKYIKSNPQSETLEPGMLIEIWNSNDVNM